MAKIGYARVSTEEQNEARQIKAFVDMGIDKRHIFIDKASGKSTENRDQLKAMLNYIREDDIVVVESISRAARNTKDLLNIVDEITSKGAGFISQKESIDTTTPQGKFMLTVFAAMAELERDSILQRQKEGIEIAKAEGKYKGRQRIAVNDSQFVYTCMDWRNGNITAVKAMEKLNLKPNTFYRRVKEMGL